MSTKTDAEILEALDFDHELACEHNQHAQMGDGPARFLIRQEKPCGHQCGAVAALCAGCWVSAGYRGVRCTKCDRLFRRDEIWTVVRVIGGAS
jgi:hypothetical protein